MISGVTNFGVFVALPNGIEGLIHVSQLDDDYYVYLEDSLMLLGKSSRRKFKLGERLEIKILASNPVQRQIDLIPGYMDLPDTEPDEVEPRGKPPKELKTPLSTRKTHPKEGERAEQNAGDTAKAESVKGISRTKTRSKDSGKESSKDSAKDGGTGKRESKSRTKVSEAQMTKQASPARQKRKRRALVFGDPGRKK